MKEKKNYSEDPKNSEYCYLPPRLEIFKVLMKGKQMQSFSDTRLSILSEVKNLALSQCAMIGSSSDLLHTAN